MADLLKNGHVTHQQASVFSWSLARIHQNDNCNFHAGWWGAIDTVAWNYSLFATDNIDLAGGVLPTLQSYAAFSLITGPAALSLLTS